MSTNSTRELIYRENAKGSNGRTVLVYEHDNSVQFDKTTNPIYFDINRGSVKDVSLLAHTYVHLECLVEYENTHAICDMCITDRFTLDSVKETAVYIGSALEHKQLKSYSIFQYALDSDARISTDERINGKKFASLHVILSMADFPHFGDVCFMLYNETNKKDEFVDPIIVQFTNAPTVYSTDLYKWHPGDIGSTTAIEDTDNVFASGFGSKLNNVADTGRTNIYSNDTSDTANYYNELYTHDRLITNGLRNDKSDISYDGHPVYEIEYIGFVPSSFSSAFGELNDNVRQPVTFSAVGSAYIQSATDFNLDNEQQIDTYPLYTYTNDDMYSAYTQITAITSTNTADNTIIPGSIRKFVAYCTAFSGDKATHDDKWFREHTRVCADFALSGVAKEWLE